MYHRNSMLLEHYPKCLTRNYEVVRFTQYSCVLLFRFLYNLPCDNICTSLNLELTLRVREYILCHWLRATPVNWYHAWQLFCRVSLSWNGRQHSISPTIGGSLCLPSKQCRMALNSGSKPLHSTLLFQTPCGAQDFLGQLETLSTPLWHSDAPLSEWPLPQSSHKCSIKCCCQGWRVLIC